MSSIAAITREFIVGSVTGSSATASNIGSGVGIFDAKVGNDLQFKKLLSGSGIAISAVGQSVKIDNTLGGDVDSIQQIVSQLSIDFANASGVWIKDGLNVGSGQSLFKQNNPPYLEFKTLAAGSGMHLSSDDDHVIVHKVNPRNLKIVQKNPGLGSFGSIKDAIDSISDNSESNPYLVYVNPGIYEEQKINMKSFVFLQGCGEDVTIISGVNPNDHVVEGADKSFISYCLITGASGLDKAAIHYSSSGPTNQTFFTVENCRFGDNYSNIICEGAASGTRCIVLTNNCKIGNGYKYTKGFIGRTGVGGIGRVQIRVLTSTGGHNPEVPEEFATADGPGCEIVCNSVQTLIGTPPIDNVCLRATNGGRLRIFSINMNGWGTAILLDDIGLPPTILAGNTVPENCTMDLIIEHPQASGSYNGSADPSKIFIDPSARISAVYLHTNADKGISVIGDLFLGSENSLATNVTDLIQRTTPTGAIEGGVLSSGIGPLDVNVSAGNGYCENTTIVKNRKVVWSAVNLTLPDDSNNFIFVTASGSVTHALSIPDIEENIFLGRAVTLDGGLHYISKIPMLSEHHSSKLETFIREALGPIYVAGSIVTENATSGFHIDISPGTYYFSSLKFTPMGGTDLDFHQHFHVSGNFDHGPHTKIVNNSQYDNGTDLVPLSSGYFTKHTLYVLGEDDEEDYALIFGQAQYSDLADAQTGGLPTPLPDFTDAVVPIAAIIVQQGASGISEIQDVRPRIGFAAVTVSTANDHGNLTGILDDDHTQYLLVNGTRGMTGNIDMNGNNIVDVSLVDGVDVSAHASRHLPAGADPLDTDPPVSIAALVNSEGTANSLSRADHVHAHGSQPGGTLHSVATTGVAGFISGPDKTSLLYASGVIAGNNPMLGDLNMGTNDITNVGLVDGINVTAHASRHLPSGVDAIATGSPVSIGTSNSPGTADSLIRSDHIHAHGNQAGGSLHAVATSGVAGFMSASDKLKLDNFIDVYKTANEVVTGSAAFQDDDHLFSALPANSAWYFELTLFLTSTATAGDWKIQFTNPAGATMLWGPHEAAGQINWNMVGTGAAPDALLTEASLLAFGSAANTHGAFIRGLVRIGSTAGTFQLQWAQNTANAAVNTMLAGSRLNLRRAF